MHQRPQLALLVSGRNKGVLTGLATFARTFPQVTPLVVGTGGILLEVFLSTPVQAWFA